SPIEQDLYSSRLADELNVEKNSIKLQLNNYSAGKKRREQRTQYKKIVDNNMRDTAKVSRENNVSVRRMKAEDRLIGLILKYPDCRRLCIDFDTNKLSDGFIKKVFEAIISRLDANLDIDLINFGDMLTSNELGRLSGIIAGTGESKNVKKEFSDCLATVNEEFEQENASCANDMSDDDFRKLFNRNT
ncbi:MAG: hypothetical protein ACI4IQ_07080, partial [Eubacterium sp.]